MILLFAGERSRIPSNSNYKPSSDGLIFKDNVGMKLKMKTRPNESNTRGKSCQKSKGRNLVLSVEGVLLIISCLPRWDKISTNLILQNLTHNNRFYL